MTLKWNVESERGLGRELHSCEHTFGRCARLISQSRPTQMQAEAEPQSAGVNEVMQIKISIFPLEAKCKLSPEWTETTFTTFLIL